MSEIRQVTLEVLPDYLAYAVAHIIFKTGVKNG